MTPFLFQAGASGCFSFLIVCAGFPQSFVLPTPNRALFETNRQNHYFVPTPGKEWISGTFGCVRTDGWQLHEGLDIKCVQRNKSGEPIDPVVCFAAGTVVYINPKASLSNFGKYLIVRHQIHGVELYSTYAHLSAIDSNLRIGTPVNPGSQLGIMGRTANTRQGISKERAHLHFEMNLLINDQFPVWFQKNLAGERNDHGLWNGRNLVGIDPKEFFLRHHEEKTRFSLLKLIGQQPELCRVLVRDTSFPWLKRYSILLAKPTTASDSPVGYELVMNFNGLPFQILPRTAKEIPKGPKYQLLRVNAEEYRKNPCRKLVRAQGNRWELTDAGIRWLDLLTF